MVAESGKPTVLVVTPMPAFPASAGNRRRLVASCEALQRGGFAVDLAYFQHEDQIYSRFGQQPPTDACGYGFGFPTNLFYSGSDPDTVENVGETGFSIDAWCPDEAVRFVEWYFAAYPETCAIVVNYVLSLAMPRRSARRWCSGLLTRTNRFPDRQLQYRPFRSEPNFSTQIGRPRRPACQSGCRV